ncbi:AMP-binding protein [Rhodococcus fascians]|nr:AMP-binding protein [Rhodococcus fascians]
MTVTPQPWWQDLTTDTFEWNIPHEFNIASASVDHDGQDDLALVVDHGSHWDSYTFAEIGRLSRKFVTVLNDLDLAAGDRVAVMVPQGVEVLTAHLGAFRGGMVTVPLSVKFGSDAVVHRLVDSGARVLVIDAEGYERVGASLDSLPELKTILIVGSYTGDESELIKNFDASVDAADEAESTVATNSDSDAIIIYTSGTTGSPKGALHGHRILPAHMPGVRTAFDGAPQPGDVFWTPADWAWIGGLFDVLFPALAMGLPVVATRDKFTGPRALEIMRRHRVTASFIPPTALKQMRSSGVDRSASDGVALRILATGGEALGDALRDWVLDTFDVTINEFYGQTEMNMTIGTSGAAVTRPAGSMGRAFPGFVIAMLDADGREVDTSAVGEICVRSGNPGQFSGYWKQPGKTADKVRDGWIRTGDLGSVDADGNVFYQGRADDVISSAGYRIGPGEVEECLISHDAVAMAGVVGMPDPLRGEAVCAFVVLNGGVEPSDALRTELQSFVKQRLAFYQYPRQIEFVDELPMTTTGKILRRELRNRRPSTCG